MSGRMITELDEAECLKLISPGGSAGTWVPAGQDLRPWPIPRRRQQAGGHSRKLDGEVT
jgi:hypothetical protein